jgi:hypothetical protein
VTGNYKTQWLLTLATNPAAVGTSHIHPSVSGPWYDNGTGLTLTADTAVTTGGNTYNFRNWTGDVTSPPNTSNPISITMNQARSITANYNTAPTVIIGAGQTVQYSDPITPTSVTATDPDSTSMTASTQWKYSGSYSGGPASFTAGLPSNLSMTGSSTPNGSGGSTGSWTLSGKALVPAGTYTIRVTITDPDGGSAYQDVVIIVSKENMTFTYTGQQFANTSKVGGTVTVNVAALLTEEQDGNLGTKTYSSIGLQVLFTLKNSSLATITTCTGNVTQTAAQITAGQGSATCSFPGLKDGTYAVQMDLLDNGYYAADHPCVAIQVSDPGTGFVTGGGFIADPGQSPTATQGYRDNFGFEVKFLKNGNLQGNSLYIYRTVTNLGALGVVGAPNANRAYNFIIKSNAMTSLQQTGGSNGQCTPTAPCYASFSGKSNVSAVDQVTGTTYAIDASLIGNQQYFSVDVTDKSEPGSPSTPPQDSYAIRVWTSAGDFYNAGTMGTWSSGPTFTPGTQIVLSGGNIQVHL